MGARGHKLNRVAIPRLRWRSNNQVRGPIASFLTPSWRVGERFASPLCQLLSTRHISTLTTPALWRGLRRRSDSSAVVSAEWRLERAREGAEMEPTEIQARATIAAALIVTRAVEVPAMPTSGDWSRDTAALRLRDLTDYVYQMIASPQPR